MKLADAAISIAISLAVTVVLLAIIEATKRRGFDPVGDLARLISPDVPDPTENGAA